MFILDRIDRELPSLERLELKFGLSSEFFNKYLLQSVLMCSFVCSGFLRGFLCPGIFVHDILKLTLRRTEGCHDNFVISHVKLQIIAEISRQN